MLSHSSKWLMVILLSLGLIIAGGSSRQAEAKGKKHYKKVGVAKRIYRKIKRKIKHVCKKVKRGVVMTGARIQNRIMDAGVHAKSAITGKKPKRVWVCGHYKKGQKTLTNGHWRRVRKKGHHSGSSSNQGNTSAPNPAPAPNSGDPGAIAGGAPLPPVDSPAPTMSKAQKRSSKAK